MAQETINRDNIRTMRKDLKLAHSGKIALQTPIVSKPQIPAAPKLPTPPKPTLPPIQPIKKESLKVEIKQPSSPKVASPGELQPKEQPIQSQPVQAAKFDPQPIQPPKMAMPIEQPKGEVKPVLPPKPFIPAPQQPKQEKPVVQPRVESAKPAPQPIQPKPAEALKVQVKTPASPRNFQPEEAKLEPIKNFTSSKVEKPILPLQPKPNAPTPKAANSSENERRRKFMEDVEQWANSNKS